MSKGIFYASQKVFILIYTKDMELIAGIMFFESKIRILIRKEFVVMSFLIICFRISDLLRYYKMQIDCQ